MRVDFSLKNKVALVTGSTKGIGRGIALALGQAGADLIIVSRNQSDCDRVAEEVRCNGSRAIGVAADLVNNAQIDALVKRGVEEFGKIDILVNNAGTAITKRAEEIAEADFDRVVGLDQRAVFFVAQAVGRQMIKQGSGKIINVASILGLVGDRQVLPYCVAKGGVIQMTRALALEWAKYNIQVNALCPGYVITPMNEADLHDEKIYQHIIKNIPMRRLGKIEDMVGAVIFMASEYANYMTGQYIVIDGGWTAK